MNHGVPNTSSVGKTTDCGMDRQGSNLKVLGSESGQKGKLVVSGILREGASSNKEANIGKYETRNTILVGR